MNKDLATGKIRLITGMSRAGTTAMAEALNGADEICCFGETRYFSLPNSLSPDLSLADIERFAVAMDKSFVATGRAMEMQRSSDPDRVNCGQIIAASIRNQKPPLSGLQLFEEVGRAVARHAGKPIWVEKTPHHLLYVDRILEQRPDSRVLVMLRSPAEFMRSYRSQGRRKEARIGRIHQRMYNPILVSLVCRNYLRAAAHLAQDWPDNVLIVKLEDIRKTPEAVMASVQRHLQLPASSHLSIVPTNSSFTSAIDPTEPSKHELGWLAALTNGPARNLGFPPLTVGLSVSAVICGLVSLSIWPFRNLSTFAQIGPRLIPTIMRLIRGSM